MLKPKYRHFVTGAIFIATSAFAEKFPTETNTLVSEIGKVEYTNKSMTADRQGQSKADINVTKRIRQEVVADKSISMGGKNVTIVTSNGLVVLKGLVANQEERERIDVKAVAIAGAGNVSNYLEVKDAR